MSLSILRTLPVASVLHDKNSLIESIGDLADESVAVNSFVNKRAIKFAC